METQHDIGIVVLTNDIDKTHEGYRPDKISYMRLEATAIEYHWMMENSIHPCVIISGGRIRSGPTLAEVLEHTAVTDFNITRSDIFKEEKSLNTVENAIFSIEELARRNINNCYIITNDFQLPRAMDCFRLYGPKKHIHIQGFSAEYIITKRHPERTEEIDSFLSKKDTIRRYEHNRKHRIIMNIPLIGPLLLRYGVRVQMALLGERPQEKVGDD